MTRIKLFIRKVNSVRFLYKCNVAQGWSKIIQRDIMK